MAKDTKKGLGRGLSELFGDDILNNENEGELIYAPIAKVEPRAEQPRNRFDDDALQELADSIEKTTLADQHSGKHPSKREIQGRCTPSEMLHGRFPHEKEEGQ